jgi:hypothetical protein
MYKPKKIENPIESTINRDEVVWNHNAGALVFDNTTGKQRVHLTHRSGANWYMNDKVVSTFSPNDLQELAFGNVYKSTKGDSFLLAEKNQEMRSYGDLRMITGSPTFFRETLAKDYVDKNRDLATVKTAPELTYPAQGNNSGAVFEGKGNPNPKSGAIDGGKYESNPVQENVTKLMSAGVAGNVELEKKMGVGGNIIMASCKHVSIIAGTSPVNYDSGIIVNNGRSVTEKYRFNPDTGQAEEVQTATPVYEAKDTSSAIPFGDIHLKAMTKLNMAAGSGGINITTSGNANFNTTGRLLLGGAEVCIGGGTSGNGGRVTIVTDKDIFQESSALITHHAPHINTAADAQYTIISPETLATGNFHIQGNLRVQGNLHVEGDIVCNGGTGISVPNGDVVASGISLVNHKHPGDSGGTTGPPQ